MATKRETNEFRSRRSDHTTKFTTRRERLQSPDATVATNNPASVAGTASTVQSMSSYQNNQNSSPRSAASPSPSPRLTGTSESRFTSTGSSPQNQKRAARAAARRAKTSRFGAESNSNQSNHVTPDNSSFTPGAFSVPGTNSVGSPYNENMENRSEIVNPDLDRPLSLVIAAQVVDHLEGNDIPDEDLELKIEQEVESRLMRRDQTLVVAEVVPPPTNPINPDTLTDQASCKQFCWKWKYLLFFLLLFIVGAITGVSIWARSDDGPPPALTDSPTQGPTLDPRQTGIVDTLETNVNTIHFDDPNSAQSRARDWLLFNDTNTLVQSDSVPPLVVLERFVLAVLFYSTNGTTTISDTPWKNQLQFLSDRDVCEWNDGSQVLFSQVLDTFGVYCEESEVTHIRLSQNDLDGTIPSELSLLTKLQVLGLENNTIGETIPTELGRLTTLQKLFLHTNRLEGNLPSELGQLQAMSDLQLHTNNMITTFPTEMGNMTALIWFDLYNNRIYGTLPTEVGQLTLVQRFHLNGNDMTGQLPTELGNMISMISFRVYSNDFTGTLPTEMAELTNLQQLYVHDNILTVNFSEEVFKANNPNLDLSYYRQRNSPERRDVL